MNRRVNLLYYSLEDLKTEKNMKGKKGRKIKSLHKEQYNTIQYNTISLSYLFRETKLWPTWPLKNTLYINKKYIETRKQKKRKGQ